MAEVASERLNYLSKKQRAVSSRASRHIIPCSNGVTFQPEQTARIDIAGNQMATYWDVQNSYLRFTVENTSATDAVYLESAWALIDRLEVLADGQTISNISNYGALIHQYLDSEVGQNWKDNIGRGLAGTSFNANTLDEIGTGDSRTYCIPLPFNPLYSSSKYIPLMGRSTLSYRITWASAAKGTIGGTTASLFINPCEMVCQYIRLSAEANAMVMANTGGRFELICSDVRTAEGNISANDNILSVNCGFSFSSLDRVSFSFYPTLNTAATLSVSNRSCADLTDFSLSVNGEEHPRKRIQVGPSNVSETIAEINVGSRSLADFQHESSLAPYRITTAANAAPTYATRFYYANPTGAEATNAVRNFETNRGVFLAMIDTEAMKPHTDPDALYSGLSTLGSVVQLVGTMNTAPTNAVVLVYAQYTLALTMDMNGSQTWVVSI